MIVIYDLIWAYFHFTFFFFLITDAELNHLFDSIENLSTPLSIYTIEKVYQLARKYVEQATDVKLFCDTLNVDQFLQHQGTRLTMKGSLRKNELRNEFRAVKYVENDTPHDGGVDEWFYRGGGVLWF